MLRKCERKYNDDTFWKEDLLDDKNNKLLIMISADWVEYQLIEEAGANVVSFNLILINKKLIKKGYTST